MDSDSEARAASRCVWTEAEDQVLRDMAEKYKGEYWNTVARAVGEFAPPEGQRKTAKQCRERWHNQLNPVVHLGPLTSQEEAKVFSLHQQFGNRWSKIAGKLPGRTDNVVKNYFFCRLRKLVRCIKHGKGKALYPKSDDELVQTLYLLDYLYKYYVSPKRLENISHTLNSQTKRRKNNGDKYINKMVVDEGITAEKIGTFSLTLLATSPPASKALDLQAYAYMQELALNDGTSPANLCGQSAHAEDSKSGTTEARSGDVINSDASRDRSDSMRKLSEPSWIKLPVPANLAAAHSSIADGFLPTFFFSCYSTHCPLLMSNVPTVLKTPVQF